MTKKEYKKIYKDIPDVVNRARPFYIKSKPENDTLVILVHGFSSSPLGLHLLADFLAEDGIDVECLLLAGHGSSFNNLRDSNYNDWYNSLEEVIKNNLHNYKRVFLIGNSFGANLSIHGGIRFPQIKGFISLGIPIFLKAERPIRFFLPMAKFLKKKYRKPWIKNKQLIDLKDKGHHRDLPLPSIVNFYHFIDHYTKKEVNQLNIPSLIIHSRDDIISHPKSSEFLYKNINSSSKHLFILNKRSHDLIGSTRRDFIFKKISEFIKQY